jgi:signal transduction histidine kinase
VLNRAAFEFAAHAPFARKVGVSDTKLTALRDPEPGAAFTSLERAVFALTDAMTQVLNLLSNALKFIPEGGSIEVGARVRDACFEISVTDSGVGIAPEDQATVFEEFRQVGATAQNVEGTGLGLAISRKFVELHGGRKWVASEVGQGATFAFTVPLISDSVRQIA